MRSIKTFSRRQKVMTKLSGYRLKSCGKHENIISSCNKGILPQCLAEADRNLKKDKTRLIDCYCFSYWQ